MKTITLTAEEIRMLEIQMSSNPCSAGCRLGKFSRLPKLKNGCFDCFARNSNGQYICPFQRAMESIENKLAERSEGK